MEDKYLYQVDELNQLSIKELDNILIEHGYDINDFVDKEFRVEVLSHLVEC